MLSQPETSSRTADLWNDPFSASSMDFALDPAKLGMASSHLDHIPTSVVKKMNQSTDSDDLATMLTKIGVQKYIRELKYSLMKSF